MIDPYFLLNESRVGRAAPARSGSLVARVANHLYRGLPARGHGRPQPAKLDSGRSSAKRLRRFLPGVALAALCVSVASSHAGLAPSSTSTPATPSANHVTVARPELEIPRSTDHDYDPPAPGSYALPVLKPAADGAVLDCNGRSRTLRELTQGRVTVLSFIYLRCASGNACPRATGMLRQVHRVSAKDPALAQNLRLITMSFDPAHDTPDRMKAYSAWSRTDKPSAEWLFLTTRSQQELRPILEAYDQIVDRRANPNDPLGPYFHPVRVYLIDRQGRIRNIYSFGMLDPRLIVTDVRTLLLEETSASLTP
jgi:cytochrome oxidase Cu insertion factor (SCO1/SenC/PrrC family)